MSEPAPQPPAERPPSLSMVEYLDQALRDPKITADKLGMILEYFKEREIDWRRRRYDEDFFALQGALKGIKRNRENKETKSAYADQHLIDFELQPLCQEYGFGLSFEPCEGPRENHVYMRAHISHRDGDKRVFGPIAIPYDTTGPKGARNKTDTHGAGSAYTYAQRYTCARIFWLRFGEDDDGNAAGGLDNEPPPPPPSPPLTPTAAENTWLGKVERALIDMRDDPPRYLGRLKAACEKVENIATLQALEKLPIFLQMRQKAPPPSRVEIDSYVQLARTRLMKARDVVDENDNKPAAKSESQKPSDFKATLISAWGEVVGDFTDPRKYAEALIDEWRKVSEPEQRALIEHNADGIHDCNAVLQPKDPLVEGWAQNAKQEGGDSGETRPPPLPHEPVRPIIERGRAMWTSWPRLLLDDMAGVDAVDLLDWLEVQREVLAEAPHTQRALVLSVLIGHLEERSVSVPDWVPGLVSEDDDAWAEKQIKFLKGLTATPEGRSAFRLRVNEEAVATTMGRLRREKPSLFAKVRNAMQAADRRLPKTPKGGQPS